MEEKSFTGRFAKSLKIAHSFIFFPFKRLALLLLSQCLFFEEQGSQKKQRNPSRASRGRVAAAFTNVVQKYSLLAKTIGGRMKTLSAFGLAILLLMPPASLAAQKPGDQVRQTVDKLLAILKDPQLKGEGKKNERRNELREVLYQRFDFTDMAKRSLGSNWRRRSPDEQKEFVKLFTNLLEGAYLDKIESYNGEKVQYLKETGDGNDAQVNTRIIDNKGQEFSVNYRLHNVDGDWKVYDVIIEDISLVNNYRSQFNHVLARSSYEELVKKMREKEIASPRAKS